MKKQDATQNAKDDQSKANEGKVLVYTPYITRKGKRIWHPTGGVFRFWATPKNVN